MNILTVNVMEEDSYNYSAFTATHSPPSTKGFIKYDELTINLETIWFYSKVYGHENITKVFYSDKLQLFIDVPYKTFDALMKTNNSKLAHLFYTNGEHQ